jgi:beta-lactamase class A
MTRRSLLAVVCFWALSPWCLAGEHPSPLAERLTALARAHKGRVAIACKNLQTGELFLYHADEVMPTASLIKFPILLEVYMEVKEGKLKLSDRVTLRDKDKVPGSGILTYHFSDGATFPLRDAVRLMIAYSDNTATNLVLARTGIPAVNQRMQAWGYPNTRLNAQVFRADTTSVDPARSKKYGLGSTTAREMIGLLEKLHKGELVSPAACREMIAHLKQCQDKDMFPRFLPDTVAVAHKNGAVSHCKTDAGLLYLPGGPVALCVLTADNDDRRWTRDNAGSLLCARIAQAVHEYYQPQQQRPKKLDNFTPEGP